MDYNHKVSGSGNVVVSMGDPLGRFLGSIVSPETRRQYKSKLDLFLTAVGMEGSLQDKARPFVEKGKKDVDWAFDMAYRFMAYQKLRCDNKQIIAGTLRNYYKPIKRFCETNDVMINWKKITIGMPKSRKFAQDRAPTTEEIRKLIGYPDRRIKAIVLVMSSSGIRVGAWDYLKWGHIEPVYKDKEVIAAKMTVYAGEDEQYPTFITPEAYHCLNEWMEFREKNGDKIGPNSWVMRDLFRTALLRPTTHHGLTASPRQLKAAGIRTMLKRAWVSHGLLKESSGGHFEFKSSHGFRKRFMTQCEQAGMKSLNVVCLLGHDTGIAGSAYYRPSDREMLEDYLKAVPFLQISEALQMKRQMAEQEKKHQIDMEKVQQQVSNIQSQLSTLLSEALLARSAVAESNRPS